MGDSGVGARAKRASKTFVSASQSAARAGATAARAGASAANGASRTLHKVTHASGAGRTGLAHLIELCGAGSVGDGFVAVALAGTLFFSASVDQARGRVALALIITMAPFALLAPFIGPVLDRVQRGRKFILIGTVLARALLCWGMAGAVEHNDAVTLLPAAFGVLLLQKAYTVTRASVTPKLLPSEITLVTANARCSLASLIATTAGVPIAAGIAAATGGGSQGAAWVLRVGTLVYLAAMVPAIRIPDGVDEPAENQAAESWAAENRAAENRAARGGGYREGEPTTPYPADGGWTDPHPNGSHGSGQHGPGQGGPGQGGPGQGGPGQGGPGQGGPGDGTSAGRKRARLRLFPQPLGPVVTEALRANITLRAYSGFMIFFLAFLLRSVHFGSVSDKLALGAMIGAVAVGGFIGTAIGAALRSKAPQLMLYVMLTFSAVITLLCAVFFGLWAAILVAFCAAVGQTLVKLALDSIVQREISPEVRSSTFAASETLHQLSWVLGGLLGLLLSLTNSGRAGLGVTAAGLAIALAWLLLSRRKRVMAGRSSPPHPASA